MNSEKLVLLVDDEPAILFAFSQFLRSPEVRIDTATTLAEALDLIEHRTYGAVIADLRLTGTTNMEGYEVVRRTKQIQPACLVIVVTAYGGEVIRENVLKLGADFYFEKPVSPQMLRSTLAQRGIYGHS